MHITPHTESRLLRLGALRLLMAATPQAPEVPSMARHWDELAAAVCDRLARLAECGSEIALRDGVQECVDALQQLHVCMAAERNSAPRPALQARTRRAIGLAP